MHKGCALSRCNSVVHYDVQGEKVNIGTVKKDPNFLSN